MFLNAHNCYHRDLKPGNIFINKDNGKYLYSLGDFSESKIVN